LSEARPPQPRRDRRAAAAVVGLAVLLGLAALYATRRIVVRELITGWLRSHGVTSQVEIEGLDAGQSSGRVSLGDPRAPDFVGDAAVTYGLSGLTPEVRSVTLRAPVLRVRLREGKLSLGTLDPLIADLLKTPPRPDRGAPRIQIEGGILLLATDAGPLRLTADAVVEAGRLVSLTARSDPARLRGPGVDLTMQAARITVRTQGERVAFTLDAPVTALDARGVRATSARLGLVGEATYPDLKRQRADGPVTVHMGLTSGPASAPGGATLKRAALTGEFCGTSHGWLQNFGLDGVGRLEVTGAGIASGGTQAATVHAVATTPDLRWAQGAGETISATVQSDVEAKAVVAGDLRLSAVSARLTGPVAYVRNGMRTSLRGRVQGQGGWLGLGAPTRADAPELASLKRAARSFRIDAPGVALQIAGSGAPRVDLPQPASLRADGGAVATLSARGAAPVFGPGGGAFRLAMAGPGLPALQADVVRLRLASGGATIQGEAKVAGSVAPVADGAATVSGTLRIARGEARFTADRCAPISARRLVFGANDLGRLSGQLCPAQGPMFAAARGGWRFDAEARALAADAPFLQARLAAGAGRLTADLKGGALGVHAAIGQARILDSAAEPRFNEALLTGVANLDAGHWTADLKLSTPAGAQLAEARVEHDAARGRGGVDIDSGPLVFAAGGLQPAQLSPLAQALGPPVQGQARFTGRLDWTADGVTSHGLLNVPGLDFQSPAGKVSGLTGSVRFSSLAPLIAAPGQMLRIGAIAAIVPVTAVTAAFGLDEKALTLTGGEAAVEGGRVRIETLRIPLAGDGAMSGVLQFEGVQLRNVVEASPFADRVDLDARVSGRVPFTSQGGKLRIASAELHAIQPGRLSIQRQALSGVAASGSISADAASVAAVPPNDTFTDFAYQAMENLAFDKLDATIASRDDGRLGVLAHIVGRHDPPQHQEIRLSLLDLIRRRFLDRPLPLPSDTGVDLTLDTSLNLDDLVAEYADYQNLRSSRPVQPTPATTETKPVETPR
jgi:hypothetical protein